MSGLAALFHRDGRPVCRSTLSAMLAAVPYRGPDGMEIWLGDAVGLGQAKMAVTPEEEHEHQPLISPRTACMLIADVRLDNREDLLARLPDRPLPAASDAELILRAYEAWGIDAAVHLLGDFAFVVWDPRHRRLVCARDTGGQRSLFYRADHRTFAAASEIHQLLQDPSVLVTPNDEHIRNFLVPLNAYRTERDCADTFYEGIYPLRAGHVLAVDQNHARVHQYWQLEPPRELRYKSDDIYAEQFLSLFSEAVRARLRSSRPVGAMLSGGLDSSSVVCVAQELYRAGRAEDHGLTSFSYVFDGLECDERHLIEDIQGKYGIRARYVTGSESIAWFQPEPQGFQESPTTGVSERVELYRAASQEDVRVLLTGMVADSCVPGSPLVFDSLLRRGHLRASWRYLQAYRRMARPPLRSLLRTLLLTGLGPLLPLGLQRQLMSVYVKWAVRRVWDRLLPSWMPEELREDLRRRHLALCLQMERGRRFASPAHEEEYRLLSPPENDRSPVGWPLEFRHPFADRRLHEFLLAIPPEQKWAPHPSSDDYYAASKWLVRRALRGILPESIRARTSKTYFSAVFQNEIERRWPCYEAAFGPAAKPEIAARGYVDQQQLWARLQELRSGVETPDVRYVTLILGLETWLRTLRLPRSRLVTVATVWRENTVPVHTRTERAAHTAGASR